MIESLKWKFEEEKTAIVKMMVLGWQKGLEGAVLERRPPEPVL